MLPGYVSGVYTYDECHIDLAVLAAFAKCKLIHSEAVGLDLQAKKVYLKNRPPVQFDVLSIDIGISPAARNVPGALLNAVPVKPIDGFVKKFDELIARLKSARRCGWIRHTLPRSLICGVALIYKTFFFVYASETLPRHAVATLFSLWCSCTSETHCWARTFSA